MAARPSRLRGSKTNNYFKVVYYLLDNNDQSRAVSAFFFFNDEDRVSIDLAFGKAKKGIEAMSILEGAESPHLSVFRRVVAQSDVVEIGEVRACVAHAAN